MKYSKNYSRDKLKHIILDGDLSVYWLANKAKEKKIMSASAVFKYFSGETDLSSEKFILLIGQLLILM